MCDRRECEEGGYRLPFAGWTVELRARSGGDCLWTVPTPLSLTRSLLVLSCSHQLWVSALRKTYGVDIGAPHCIERQQLLQPEKKKEEEEEEFPPTLDDQPLSPEKKQQGKKEKKWRLRWDSPPRPPLINGGGSSSSSMSPSSVRARIRQRRRAPSSEEEGEGMEGVWNGFANGGRVVGADYGVPRTFMVGAVCPRSTHDVHASLCPQP